MFCTRVDGTLTNIIVVGIIVSMKRNSRSSRCELNDDGEQQQQRRRQLYSAISPLCSLAVFCCDENTNMQANSQAELHFECSSSLSLYSCWIGSDNAN